MMDWKIYRQAIAIKSPGQVEKLIGEKVPEGYILEIVDMSITDISLAGQALELGFIDVGGIDRVICINQLTAGVHHHLTGEVLLEAGEQPYGRVTTAGSNDLCYFFCNGKLWKKE